MESTKSTVASRNLTETIENNDYDRFIELINSGVDVNWGGGHHNISGFPIYAAVVNSDSRYLEILLKHNVNLEVTTCCCSSSYGMLHFGAICNRPKSIRILIDAGMDVNHQSTYDVTPLMLAAKHNHVECILELIKLGANIYLTTNEVSSKCDGYIPENTDTCLSFAISECNYEAIDVLINECAFDVFLHTDNLLPLLVRVQDEGKMFKIFLPLVDKFELLRAVAGYDQDELFTIMLEEEIFDQDDETTEQMKDILIEEDAGECFYKYLTEFVYYDYLCEAPFKEAFNAQKQNILTALMKNKYIL